MYQCVGLYSIRAVISFDHELKWGDRLHMGIPPPPPLMKSMRIVMQRFSSCQINLR